jgi:hypothetical protein
MVHRPISFDPSHPIGFCIYCGVSDGALLSDEHVAPEGLQGDLILRRASCKECAKLTSYSELRTLRGPLGAVREFFGLYGNRRRCSRREAIPLEFLRRDWSVETITVPVYEYPLVFRMPRFPAPRFLAPVRKDDADFLRKQDYRQGDSEDGIRRIQELLRLDPGRERVLLDMQVFELSKVLAKIAYCFAVYFLGPYSVRPFVTDLITAPKGRAPHFLYYVGGAFWDGDPIENLAPNDLGKCVVRIEPHGSSMIVLARVQLLGYFKMPVYEVVVGELSGSGRVPHVPTPRTPTYSYQELLSKSFTIVETASG